MCLQWEKVYYWVDRKVLRHDFWTGKFFSKKDPYRGRFVGKSIARIPKRENAFLTLIQGRGRYIKAKMN
jgi:hypothetical protein